MTQHSILPEPVLVPPTGSERVAVQPPFELAATQAVARVRKALSDLIAALPGGGGGGEGAGGGAIRRAKDLEQILHLDYKLCWRIFSVVRAEDSLAAVIHIPKTPSVERLVKAASRLGVPPAPLRSLESAFRYFDEVVEAHAGDRADFDAMVAAISPTNGQEEEIDPAQRRAAFRCNSHIWGTQVDIFGMACIVRASASGTQECVLNTKLGLRRLRRGVNPIVHGYHHFAEKKLDAPPQRVPLDAAAAERYGAPLLPNFCTQPMPTFRRSQHPNGWTYDELVGNEVGRRSAVDLSFGGIVRDVPFTHDTDGRRLFRASITFHTPTATMIGTLLVHRPSLGVVKPEFTVFKSTPGEESPEIARRAQQLPIHARVVALGSGVDVLSVAELPRLGEMLQFALDTLEWDIAEFDVYRVRLAYPVLNSTAQMFFYL